MAYCRFRFHWFLKRKCKSCWWSCCGANKRSLVICKWHYRPTHTHIQQTGIQFCVVNFFLIIYVSNDNRAALCRRKSCKWTRKPVCFYLCVQGSSINRVFVNSLRNKQIGWKKGGNKPIIPLSLTVANKKRRMSMCTSLIAMQICWLMLRKQ